MPDLANLRIDGPRLWDGLMETAKIGATPKGGSPGRATTPATSPASPPPR